MAAVARIAMQQAEKQAAKEAEEKEAKKAQQKARQKEQQKQQRDGDDSGSSDDSDSSQQSHDVTRAVHGNPDKASDWRKDSSNGDDTALGKMAGQAEKAIRQAEDNVLKTLGKQARQHDSGDSQPQSSGHHHPDDADIDDPDSQEPQEHQQHQHHQQKTTKRVRSGGKMRGGKGGGRLGAAKAGAQKAEQHKGHSEGVKRPHDGTGHGRGSKRRRVDVTREHNKEHHKKHDHKHEHTEKHHDHHDTHQSNDSRGKNTQSKERSNEFFKKYNAKELAKDFGGFLYDSLDNAAGNMNSKIRSGVDHIPDDSNTNNQQGNPNGNDDNKFTDEAWRSISKRDKHDQHGHQRQDTGHRRSRGRGRAAAAHSSTHNVEQHHSSDIQKKHHIETHHSSRRSGRESFDVTRERVNARHEHSHVRIDEHESTAFEHQAPGDTNERRDTERRQDRTRGQERPREETRTSGQGSKREQLDVVREHENEHHEYRERSPEPASRRHDARDARTQTTDDTNGKGQFGDYFKNYDVKDLLKDFGNFVYSGLDNAAGNMSDKIRSAESNTDYSDNNQQQNNSSGNGDSFTDEAWKSITKRKKENSREDKENVNPHQHSTQRIETRQLAHAR